MGAREILVWDLPLRLFHWALAALIVAAVATAQLGGNLMLWHGRIGLAILGLLVFRLVWGFAGSTHARFASFVRSPAAVAAYLRGQAAPNAGHSPVGALAVLALLALLAFQSASGLFANDDIAFQGPLYALLSKSASDLLTGLHRKGAWLLYALTGLHVAAVLFYLHVKKQNLVRPMLTGRKQLPAGAAEPARGGSLPAFLLATALAAGAVWIASGALLAPPPPPPLPTAAPAW